MFLDVCLKSRPASIETNTLQWQNHLFGLVAAIAELKQQIPRAASAEGASKAPLRIYQMIMDVENHLQEKGARIKKEVPAYYQNPDPAGEVAGMMGRMKLEETKF